jgi:hypothetical protein
MPGIAESALQEPEHELAVVQQVQKGSITSAGTKAQLTVKLPGRFVEWLHILCSQHTS